MNQAQRDAQSLSSISSQQQPILSSDFLSSPLQMAVNTELIFLSHILLRINHGECQTYQNPS